MADSIRELIIKDIMAQVAEITLTNGYNYDMGTPLRAHTAFDPSLLPLSVVFPGIEENERKFGKHYLDFSIRIESHMETGSTEASVIQEKLLADLITNLLDPSDVWSTYIDDVAYIEGGPAEQPAPDNTMTAVFVSIMVKYKTDIGAPYSNS